MTNAELDEKLALAARAVEAGWAPDVYAARVGVPALVAAVREARASLDALEQELLATRKELTLALAVGARQAAQAQAQVKPDAPKPTHSEAKPAPPKPPTHRRHDSR